jgi:hypothetical protein
MQHKKGIGDQAKENTMERIVQEIGQGAKIDVAELAYKKMLLALSKKLDGFSLSGFKFLCEGQIPKKARENIREATDLWQAMQERGLLGRDNLGFLKWMLKEGTENRTDLVAVVEKYEREYGVLGHEGHHFAGIQEDWKLPEAKGQFSILTCVESTVAIRFWQGLR